MHEVMNCRQAHPSSSPKCALGIHYLISGMAQSDAGRSEGKEGITRVWAKVNSTNRDHVKRAHWALGLCRSEANSVLRICAKCGSQNLTVLLK